jgi:hypothetical protein
MELLSRQGTFVSAACKACFLSMTIPEHVWETAVNAGRKSDSSAD